MAASTSKGLAVEPRLGNGWIGPRSIATSIKVYQELKATLHRELLSRIDLERLTTLEDVSARMQVQEVICDLIARLDTPLSAGERERLSREVLHEVFGLGPLEPLLQDPTVNDILVNTYRSVYVERSGMLEKTSVVFKDEAHLRHIIDKIVSNVGRRVDESSPMCDARLSDGSRVNVIIPPLAVDGPILSIRRFGRIPIGTEQLLANRTVTGPIFDVLKGAVRAKLNILVSGGTGSGKTTLLNVLSGYIGESERVVTIEDAAELQLRQEHVVRLECRPPNVEGKGAVRPRELVINALRMRPDRIVVGEVRGEEALDMMQAMNTGHDGSLTTIHANTPRDAVSRLETMALMANLNLPETAVRQQIASAVSIVVQIARMSDGKRRITHVTEITGMTGEVVAMQDIFVFEKLGIDAGGHVVGRFRATGVCPKFAEKLKTTGIVLSPSTFEHTFEV
ncbi:MAG TPA: CpaF family protein [Candidatus Bathyarchaeia archaeon]|nr:CpaF family protein [Candidatus Bathyarchaeia archaeon]